MGEARKFATKTPRKRLGELLQERGHISHQNLANVIAEQAEKALLLGELLMERGVVSKSDLVAALEEVTHVRYLDASATDVDSKALNAVPYSVAKRCCALPVLLEEKKLVIVMAEPQNLYALDELAFVSGLKIVPRLGFHSEIQAAIRMHYENAGQNVTTEADALSVPEIEFFSLSARQSQRDAIKEFQAELRKQPTPAVRMFSAVVAAAASKKASDIHIDPQAGGAVVRIRVDGMLRELMEVPHELQDSLVSRIKILADMDIAERRAPQDGRLLVKIGGHKRDLRVATLPTHYGEKVVIRLLDSRAALVRFQDLGLWEEHADLLAYMLSLPQGMLLVTGPTGSGKTTTLYAALNVLRSQTLNIITVENPVEYMLEGINQVQVNEKAGRTFASCLRSILRQDPNVIMVGEIRDGETAEIALTAAQTGHLVLSTLHTKDSLSAVTRLIDLNIPPFLVASTVTAVVAQRLVRRLCACRDEVATSAEYLERLRAAGTEDFAKTTFIPAGCPACDNTGYRGRVGIYEMLVFDEQISEAIREGLPPEHVRSLAASSGMRFLQEDALLKAKMGLTSLEEVMRVVPLRNLTAELCPNCKQRLVPTFAFCPHCAWDRRGGGRKTGHVVNSHGRN